MTHFLRRRTKTALYHVAEFEFCYWGESDLCFHPRREQRIFSFPKASTPTLGCTQTPSPSFPKPGPANNCSGYRNRSRESLNKNLEIPREFLSSGWQYWTNLYALATVSLFCSGQFVLRVIFTYMAAKFSYIGVTMDMKDYFKNSSKEKMLGNCRLRRVPGVMRPKREAGYS